MTHDWARGDFATIVVLQPIGQAFLLFPLIVIAVASWSREARDLDERPPTAA